MGLGERNTAVQIQKKLVSCDTMFQVIYKVYKRLLSRNSSSSEGPLLIVRELSLGVNRDIAFQKIDVTLPDVPSS